MKNNDLKKNLVLVAIAIILSLGIFRWHSLTNVPFCINTAGCTGDETVRNQKRIGNIYVTDFGFPLVYRHTEQFTIQNPPNPNQDGETGHTTTQRAYPSFSLPSVIVNVIFWYALWRLLARFIPFSRKPRVENQSAPAAPVAKQ